MKWSVDTHKYISEVTRKALQIMVSHNISSESSAEEIDAVERELGASGVYKDYEGARGRVRRALFTYFKAYGCLDDSERLTEIGKLYAEGKISVREFSFYYILNYIYEEGEIKYYPANLILKFLKIIHEIAPEQAYMSAYDFSKIVECNGIENISEEFVRGQINERSGAVHAVNERSIGYDVWAKMLIQAGILTKNEDKNLVACNYDMIDWILTAFSQNPQTEKGKLCTGVLRSIPVISVDGTEGDASLYEHEGRAAQAFLFDAVDDYTINKYIYSVDNSSFDNMKNDLGIASEQNRGFYGAFVGAEKLVGYVLTLNTNDAVRNIGEIIVDVDVSDSQLHECDDINEYNRAAKILKEYITESGYVIPISKADIESVRQEFVKRYDYKQLAALSDEELLSRVFYTTGDNTEALCCWIEMNKECKNCFGSISGGSAYKFGLFQKKETGLWTTGSPQKPQELSDDEAVQRGREIVNALICGAEIIENATLESLADYEKLDEELREAVGEQFYTWAWFHKYYSILFPDKLSSYHSPDWQCHVLRSLGIKPSEKYYARSGQICMIQKYADFMYREFGHVFFDKFGGIKNFVRMGTSDEEKSYVAEWKQRSVIGLGWKALGSLDNYTAGDGVDRAAIAEKLEENYYPNDSKTASRKAGEIARFYKTDDSTIFVAMAGEKLIAFVDDIGSYFYDGNTDMSHLKSGQWHLNFSDGETLPTKSEGKLTSCYPLTDEENLMFLYKKYYFPDEEMELEEISYDDEDPEERNKRLFKYWMAMQVKPEGDSNAGEPYSTNVINSYVSNIQNTPLPMVADRSVFYTTEIAQVQTTIEVLDNSEKKNNTQRSAIKKYLQYLIATKEEYMPLIFNTNIETKYERNRIVFGAPGTGKSYGLKDDCEKLMADTAGTYERVTFHPDYSYAQFVGTYKPVMDVDGRSIKYDFVPGPFMRVYVDALKSGRTDAPQPHLLLIEEINRAKVAAVFGDVFQLLDRDDDGVSEYEIQASEDIRRYLAAELGGTADNYKKIRIPNNMFIWATMNSADQGVFPMDTAFKRRWNFEYLGINENEEEIQGIGKIMLPGSDEPIEWNTLRKAINDKMSSSDFKINEDKLMGPFFLSKKVIASNENGMIIDKERFIDAFKSKVIMYLYEDAVKQGKHRFFDGCDSSKYSSVCEAFDTMGTAIFGATFRETFYDKQRNDA